MAHVSIQDLRKQFGDSVAVEAVTLDIADGELIAFLGPSGCGKTTTLRMIAGFIEPTAGAIHIDGTEVTHVPVHKRNTGMVFQRYALFPHMTVTQNVAFGLEMHKVPMSEREGRIRQVLDMLHMTRLKDRYPRQLSGGQQQRVAIARALAIQPKVFLLDEPLSNLDASLRVEVREEIRTLQQRLGLTTIFVTHDQDEAMAISDRMAIMNNGVVQQIGAPEDVYERPANLFVADFLGKMNFFEGRTVSHDLFQSAHGTPVRATRLTQDIRHVGIRPERVRLVAGPQVDNALPGVIESVTYLGSVLSIHMRLDSGERISSLVSNSTESSTVPRRAGDRAHACFQAGDCILFS